MRHDSLIPSPPRSPSPSPFATFAMECFGPIQLVWRRSEIDIEERCQDRDTTERERERNEGKVGVKRKGGGFSFASIFSARKREAVTQDGTI